MNEQETASPSALPPTNTTELPGLNIVLVVPGFPDKKLRNTLMSALASAGGPTPVMKCDSSSALRGHYAPAMSKLIINTASPEMHQKLGKHRVVVAIEVDDRIASANATKKIFDDAGFPAEVFTGAEPEFPDGFLTFVSVAALDGIAVMFWPKGKDVTEEIAATLPKRLPWTAEDMMVQSSS